MLVLFFLSSGLFLGWSLGANDAANVFGSAVGSRMIRFGRAAVICSVFAVLGAVVGGAGASHTLGKLGAVNALGGSFAAALAAALTVTLMTRLSLPVSTSQAIVGAILGWNFFTGSLTDTDALWSILGTWILCPVLSGVFAVIFFVLFRRLFRVLKLHLLWEDIVTRWALVVVGAFGAYSLGANNIGNVMGVFVPVAPFDSLNVAGLFTFSGTQQLFLLGGLAIALGVFTYSRKVMATVGSSLLRLTPPMALVVVLSQAVVLFVFSSQELEFWLRDHGLPTLPLVPVSSSQAVIGAVLGLGILRGGHGIRYRVLGEIALGWATTPVLAAVTAFVALFFLQNTFGVVVVRNLAYVMDPAVRGRVERLEIRDPGLDRLAGGVWASERELDTALRHETALDAAARRRVVGAAERDRYLVGPERLERELASGFYAPEQAAALRSLAGREFRHGWQLLEALAAAAPAWDPERTGSPAAALALERRRRAVVLAFRTDLPPARPRPRPDLS